MTLSSPPPPPPDPPGGNLQLETRPGDDPWWWTRFVGPEKLTDRAWFRTLIILVILAAIFVTLQLAG
jgi:hypothetical protein